MHRLIRASIKPEREYKLSVLNTGELISFFNNWNIEKSDTVDNNLQNAVYLTAEADELLDTVDKEWISNL